jgi:NAD(P)H-hydrate epimerase
MTKIIQTKLLYPKVLWQRPVHSYKAEAGKIMILAGSKHKTGIAMLICEAVFRSGTGVLVLGFPESLKGIYKGVLPEAMTLELPETPGHTLSKKAENLILDNANSCDVSIIGPGLSTNAETVQLVWELLFTLKKPVVLADDGVAAFIKGLEVMRAHESEEFMVDYLGGRKNELIILMTTGEATKLAKILQIGPYTRELATILAEKLNCTVILQAKDIEIATNTGDYIITPQGASEQPTANSGDILSGVIGSFIGQNPEKQLEGIATAVYLYTKSAGNIRNLPKVIRESEED